MGEQPRDEELLARTVRGDDDAFSLLMRRHEDRIFGLAYRLTGDRADALDATQETFLSAFRRAATFRGDSSFGTWLYRICINASHDVLRRRDRVELTGEAVDRPSEAAADDTERNAITRLDVSRALARLPEDYRTAVVMHDLGGIPYDEIARATGVELGTVKSRISRGRRRLAELLEQPTSAGTSKG